MIASATRSGRDTIHLVAGLASSSAAGNPSVLTNPGSTRPTWTPCGASSAWSASLHPASANLLAE